MIISTSTLRTSLLNAALFTATVSAAEFSFNTPALSTSEATTASNWLGGVAPGAADVAAWKTDIDAVTAGNQESRGGALTISSPVSWLGLRHEDSVGPITLTGSAITLGASGITEVRWELLTINNNIVLGASQPWTNTVTNTVTGNVSGAFGITKAGTGTLILSGSNTFTGPIAASLGTLSVASLNRVAGGSPSSNLGAPLTVADGTIAMSAGGGQATLLYTGSGESSDRVIHFASGQGGIITQNGTGLLDLTSNMTGVASAMGVTLNGGGSGRINGITNTTALVNFNKGGAGTWTVTGNLTLNGGNIRPQGGILAFSPTATTTGTAIISGRTAGSALEIAGGSGIITSTANFNGILGGWATVDDNTWAVANGASPVSGLASFVTDTWASGNNTDVTVTGANPAADSTTNTLRFNANGAKTLTLAGTNSLASAGVLMTSAVGANPTLVTGGTLAPANLPGTTAGTTASDLAIHQHNSSGDLTVASVISNAIAPAARTGASTTGTKIITGLSSTSDLVVGMTVTGTGLAAGSTIASINSAAQITLNNNVTTGGTPSLTFGTSVNGLTKVGAGTLVLSAANTYNGTTNVLEGTLKVDAISTAKIYNVSQLATLQLGYNTGASVYNNGVTVNGTGAAATTGLYLKGGFSYTFQSGLILAGAPATIRTVPSTGIATLSGWDSNGTHLTVPAVASGTVLDSGINFVPGSFGYVMNIAAGANTATGDVTFQGQLTGTVNGNNAAFRKVGDGSLLLTGAGTNTAALDLRAGSVILGGGANRLGSGSSVILGNGTGSGKLVLKGNDQTLANLSTVGTGTTNAVVNGSPTLATLTVNYSGAGQTFAGTLGGSGTDDNNLAFAKSGSATYTLAGNNTYTGGTTLTGGTLSLGSLGAIGTTGVVSMNGGTLQITAANSTDYSSRMRLEDGTSSGIDTNGLNLTLVSPFAVGGLGTGGINKLGAGVLTLTASNVYTGTTTVTAGTLKLDYSVSNSSILADSSILKLAGGTLELAGGTHSEIVAATEITGAGPVLITRSSGSASIQLGNITRSSTGTLDIAAAGIATTALTNDGSGKLPAWITVGGLPASSDGSGNVVVYDGFSNVNRLGGKIPNNPIANVRIVNGGSGGAITPLTAGVTDIATLLQNATAGPATISLNPSDTLRLGAEGAVIVPATSGALTIQSGTLTAGGADETPGEIAVDAEGSLTLASAIYDNGIAGIVSLTKAGAGSLSIAESNAFSGGTTLNAGTLNLNHYQGLGIGTFTVNGGSLDSNTLLADTPLAVEDAIAQTWNNDINFIGTNDLIFLQGTSTMTGNRTVTVQDKLLEVNGLNGAFTLNKAGAGIFAIDGGDWSGVTTVTEGTLEVLARTGDVAYVVGTGGTLKLGYTNGGGYANSNIKVNGAGVAATTGLYLKGGTTYNGAGTLQLLTAPTTIRHYGSGLAGIGMFDINADGLTTVAASSGSVIDSNIEIISRGYGMAMNIAVGPATATGDLVLNGPLNVNAATFGLYKRGAGSIALNAAAATTNSGLKIQAGTVITGIDNAIGENADLPISAGAKLVLNGFNQAAAALSGAGQVVNGSATPVVFTIKQSSDQTFSGTLGGAGTDEGNFSFVKTGASKLTLSGTLAYTGSTSVSEDTLAVSSATLADAADVLLATDAVLELNSSATDVIDELIVNGVAQAPGVYGPIGSGAQFTRAYLTGNGKLEVTTGPAGEGYDDWAAVNNVNGPGVTAETDSDADGIPNGIEFVIGGDPSGPGSDSSALLPTQTVTPTHIHFVFRRTDDSAALNPFVEYSSGLAGWTEAEAGENGVTISESNDFYGSGIDRVTVSIPRSLAVGTKLFARLRVDVP